MVEGPVKANEVGKEAKSKGRPMAEYDEPVVAARQMLLDLNLTFCSF